MKRNAKVSTAVIRRLPRYYRHLFELQQKGVERISSSALGKSMGLTASAASASRATAIRSKASGRRSAAFWGSTRATPSWSWGPATWAAP